MNSAETAAEYRRPANAGGRNLLDVRVRIDAPGQHQPAGGVDFAGSWGKATPKGDDGFAVLRVDPERELTLGSPSLLPGGKSWGKIKQ